MCSYFETLTKTDCNGCGTCALRCPAKAITMEKDSEGFLYPKINLKKCINCGLCRKICSNNPKKNSYKIKAYAAKNKDLNERLCSTSGGIFKIIANDIISRGGVVFGVKFDKNLYAVHGYATTLKDCQYFSYSKYIRSDLKDTYKKVEEFLKQDKWVLFTGTPCQNYGLKMYLRKDYKKLILCEIICHSNPSPKVFHLYIKNIEKINKKKVNNYYFRNKNEKMKNQPYVIFSDGSTKIYNEFNKAFGEMLISRPSCYNCQFCDLNRKADITIGDFWGIEKVFPKLDDKKGISLLCINSEKGAEEFERIKDKIDFLETEVTTAFKYNHHCNVKPHKKRDIFFKGISDGIINENNIIKYMNKYVKVPLYKKVINKSKRVVKKIIKK